MIIQGNVYIDGTWQPPVSGDTTLVVSPATEEAIAEVPLAGAADVDRAVVSARDAFDNGPWPCMSPGERGAVLARAAKLLEARSDELAELITNEMGSPITFSGWGQVAPATGQLAYYADLVKQFSFEKLHELGGRSRVTLEPSGVVVAVVPWNAPLFIAVNKVAPALAAGCTVILKTAIETPLDGHVLAEVLTEAGLPPGALNVVVADRAVGEHLVRHTGVDKVSFTGSTTSGKRIMAACSDRITRVSLELGGKSAAVILDDADLPTTVAGLMPRMFANNGEVCTAQTRVLAPRHRAAEVIAALRGAIETLIIGDPLDPSTDIGPLVSSSQRDRVESYIRLGEQEGATIAIGGDRPDQPRGWFVAPALFTNVDNRMRIAREEIFGPVVCLLTYDDPADAIRIANDSDYGLAGSVWGTDTDAAAAVAAKLRAGAVSINGSWGAADAPFGGFKRSGFGRELGVAGLEQYLEPKSVHLAAP